MANDLQALAEATVAAFRRPLDTTELPTAFDYADMPEASVAALRKAKSEITRGVKTMTRSVFETGQHLLLAKDLLRGRFHEWVEAEAGMSLRSAQHYMQLARELGADRAIVEHLPPTTAYALSAKSTPEPVREEILGALRGGESLSPAEIERKIGSARSEARRTANEVAFRMRGRRRQLSKADKEAAEERMRKRIEREEAKARAEALRAEDEGRSIAEKILETVPAEVLQILLDLEGSERWRQRQAAWEVIREALSAQ